MTRRAAGAAGELRALMELHQLSYRDVSSLASVSSKTVESWLASAGSSSARSMNERHLTLIRAQLPGYLAARKEQ